MNDPDPQPYTQQPPKPPNRIHLCQYTHDLSTVAPCPAANPPSWFASTPALLARIDALAAAAHLTRHQLIEKLVEAAEAAPDDEPDRP